jgi:RNA polymerase sigma-70 factor (ECF subfamily)
MTGSVLDGEDVMQETLFEAYRKLDSFDDSRALSPWLFRIAHNRCIDFLRKRDTPKLAEAAVAVGSSVDPIEPPAWGLGRAVERLVILLPPMERACVLLKDVFDHSLEEIAELVESTVGGVKAALNRGRGKLATSSAAAAAVPDAVPALRPETERVLLLYVERFNRRDWEGVRELASADARLRVADCFAGRLADSPYFIEYERAVIAWRMELGEVDGEPVVIVLRDLGEGLMPSGAVRLQVVGAHIERITDYFKCPWILEASESFSVSSSDRDT